MLVLGVSAGYAQFKARVSTEIHSTLRLEVVPFPSPHDTFDKLLYQVCAGESRESSPRMLTCAADLAAELGIQAGSARSRDDDPSLRAAQSVA